VRFKWIDFTFPNSGSLRLKYFPSIIRIIHVPVFTIFPLKGNIVSIRIFVSVYTFSQISPFISSISLEDIPSKFFIYGINPFKSVHFIIKSSRENFSIGSCSHSASLICLVASGLRVLLFLSNISAAISAVDSLSLGIPRAPQKRNS
jgi:hypothetical protein